jgi:tRNA(Arg) A34 adenosine deaminase TadA
MRPVSKPALKQPTANGYATSQTAHRTSGTFARRGILMAAGIAVLLPGSRHSAPAHAAQKEAEAILQPATTDDMAFMQRAFEMQQIAIDNGDQAYGAVIVSNNIIVGQSWSRVILDADPTAHAEMAAIRDAARRLKNRDLNGAVIYSSSRPCPMCEAAAYWAGIGEMAYGRTATRAGSPKLCG